MFADAEDAAMQTAGSVATVKPSSQLSIEIAVTSEISDERDMKGGGRKWTALTIADLLLLGRRGAEVTA